ATGKLNWKIMEPFFVNAPWLDSSAAAVPEPLRHFYLAQSYNGSEMILRALEEVNKAIGLDSGNPDFYVLKTRLHLKQNKSPAAAAAALAALALSSRTIPAILKMSEDLYLKDAKAVYGKTIELGTREVDPYLEMGNIALHHKELNEAEKWLDQARKIVPDRPDVLLSWGRLMLARKELQKAKEALEQSRDRGEDTGLLHAALGELYSGLKLWDRAVESYQRAFKIRAGEVDWRHAMGVALDRLGRKKEAEQKFREVLALRPDDAEAWQELRRLGARY
ncbi:MAG: tetratricopeptide repeat protein, partial [Desulfobacterales bacterium]|nr:tetratricopeptide repeat protein [Desulfobacterales bacterium]